ncbi:MAG TPA: TolC family protein [Polyangiaceae bacterium]|nr:TolC family protein [Polyangiaceae bacterium]
MTTRRTTALRRQLLSSSLGIAVAAIPLLASAPAGATQPLETFLESARKSNYDVREQTATVEQRNWERESAKGRLLPALSARGVYTRNQYAAEIPAGPVSPVPLTITPQNQLDLFLQLDVPLVDLASYQRLGQAGHLARASSIQLEQSQNDVQRLVARAYYAYVGGAALVQAAERAQKIAEDNLAYVTTRHSIGVATELDRERARAQVEQSKQDRAQAELIGINAARNLETVSGIAPTPVEEYPLDDLHPEAPLGTWLGSTDTPSDRIQAELGRAATAAKKAAAYALLPTLSANGQERVTNATGFTGRTSAYTIQGVLSWRLDYSAYSTAQAQAAAADAQKVRSERARRGVEDDIFDAWERVRTGIIKSESTRAQADAALRAEELALARYQSGALTQLDVTQAQRDAFQAQAARIQADADLLYSRVVLRLAAGKSPNVQPSTLPNKSAKDLAVPPPPETNPIPPPAAATPPAPAANPPTATPGAR